MRTIRCAIGSVRLGVALIFFPVISGCVSARVSDHVADDFFRQGQYEKAAEQLDKGLKDQGDSGRDLLLYLLDLGLALHSAGKYPESNKAFLRADKIAEIKDYTSLATEGATFLTSENIKDYKGEDFEKVLINTYLSINYALMGDYENALVEARRVNRKLHLMVTDGQRKYKQNAFARYLSAAIYESEGNWNDAYVDYKMAAEIMPHYPEIGRELWKCALVLGIQEDVEKWDEQYHLTQEDHKAAKATLQKAKKAEIIVIYENGISPVKRPNPNFTSLPKFYSRHNPVHAAQLEVDGAVVTNTATLHDIEATAMENLDEKFGGLIAKKIAGVVAKELVADQIEKKTGSPLIGLLARVAFYASDQADLRSWFLLPKDLQVARVTVEPGEHRIRLLPSGAGPLSEKVVQVAPGKKVFVNYRYMP